LVFSDGTNVVEITNQLAGLVVGTDVQAFDAGLTDIAGLAVTDGNIIVGNGTNFVAESGATARTSLGLGTASDVQFDSFGVGTAASGTTGEIRATNDVTAFYLFRCCIKRRYYKYT
jgi:sarcosine oxidase gamma subunit